MRGAVSIALAYNQASCGNCFFWSSVFSSELYFKIQIRAVFVRESWIKEREMALMSYLIDLFYFIWMQFTRSGHTQLRANAIMITSTISVVLVSTVVRTPPPYVLYFDIDMDSQTVLSGKLRHVSTNFFFFFPLLWDYFGTCAAKVCFLDISLGLHQKASIRQLI